MVRPFLSLMLVLFLLGGTLLSTMFVSWQNERAVRMWETLRLRGYDYLYRAQYNEALRFFLKAREISTGLGKTNYHYALSMEDIARVLVARQEYDRARGMVALAIPILAGESRSNSALSAQLLDDRILAMCELAAIDLKTNRGIEKVWLDCLQILELCRTSGSDQTDPQALRKLCRTMLDVGKAAEERGNSDVSQLAFSKVEQVTFQFASLSDLCTSAQKLLHKTESGSKAGSATDLLANAQHAIEAKDFARAGDILKKAQQEAVKTSDPALAQIKYKQCRIAYAEGNYEELESTCRSLLADPGLKDDNTRDEILDLLVTAYRHCGYTEDLCKALRLQIEQRKKMYGPGAGKIVDREIMLARFLQELNRDAEAKDLCIRARDYFIHSPDKGIKGGNLQMLGGIMARNGDLRVARDCLEGGIRKEEEGHEGASVWLIGAGFDLSALALIEGKKDESSHFFKEASRRSDVLEANGRLIIAEGLRDWVLYFKKNDAAAPYMKETLLLLPVPQKRREAVRALSLLDTMDGLKSSHARAFTPEVNAHVQQVLQAAKKFRPARLAGLPSK